MAVKTIIQTFVISKLDHCNCLLQESPSPLLYRLQNMYHAARIISHARKRDHITHSGWAALAAYKTAHWLQNPTVHSQRIEWPGPCLSGWPPYRASKHYLDRAWTSSKTYGYRVFMSVAPRPWNELPEDTWNSKSLEVFKTNLNTHLYLQSFYRRTHISPLWDFPNVHFWKFRFCVVFLLVWLS